MKKENNKKIKGFRTDTYRYAHTRAAIAHIQPIGIIFSLGDLATKFFFIYSADQPGLGIASAIISRSNERMQTFFQGSRLIYPMTILIRIALLCVYIWLHWCCAFFKCIHLCAAGPTGAAAKLSKMKGPISWPAMARSVQREAPPTRKEPMESGPWRHHSLSFIIGNEWKWGPSEGNDWYFFRSLFAFHIFHPASCYCSMWVVSRGLLASTFAPKAWRDGSGCMPSWHRLWDVQTDG